MLGRTVPDKIANPVHPHPSKAAVAAAQTHPEKWQGLAVPVKLEWWLVLLSLQDMRWYSQKDQGLKVLILLG